MERAKTMGLLTARHQRVVDFHRNTLKQGQQKMQSIVFVETRLELLKGYWEKLDETVDEMRGLMIGTNAAEPYFDDGLYDEAEAAYVDARAALQQQIATLRAANVVQPEPVQQAVRVKAIEPPTFSGDITRWTAFRDLFQAVVTNNAALSNSQRLQYLEASCKEEASELIRDIPVTDANFDVAWQLLIKRYDNPRVVVARLLKQLLDFKAMAANTAAEMKRLLDGTCRVIRSLQALGRPTDQWGDILVALTVERLDKTTRFEWERSIAATNAVPEFATLETFLTAQLRTLEAVTTKTQRVHVVEATRSCAACGGAHALQSCAEFAEMPVTARKELVSKARLCYNCIGSTPHQSTMCKSNFNCRHCGRRHHTLLHDADTAAVPAAPALTSAPLRTHVVSQQFSNHEVVLATAAVEINVNGRSLRVRALIDPAAQVSIVSEAVVRRLALRQFHAVDDLTGVGQSKAGPTAGRVMLQVSSLVRRALITVHPVVLKAVTGDLPRVTLHADQRSIFDDVSLADYDGSGEIELLLGGDVYFDVMCDGMRRVPDSKLLAQNTIFGWIFTGRLFARDVKPTTPTFVHHVQLEEQLRMFWEQEETPAARIRSKEEDACEQMFAESVRREPDGRLTVHLPFREAISSLGDSRFNAERRLMQMERRFAKDTEVHRQYKEFLDVYAQLGHMRRVPIELENAADANYLAHHAVLKASSTTTKLRVVFDASMPTSSGRSLNDILMAGPRLQDELAAILMRWRLHKVAITADVEKMFRQIWVTPAHRKYQRILWRDSPSQPIGEYELATITYGTACAPYLAVRAMQRLAEEELEAFPRAAPVVQHDFYMDDCLSGADDDADAIMLKDELLNLLASGGLPLLKWASNSTAVMHSLPAELRELGVAHDIEPDDNIKTLGVRWFPAVDELGIVVKLTADTKPLTKRSVLSEIARLFDPLSFLAPVVISAKITMQLLFLCGSDWDAELPEDIAERWRGFRAELPALAEIRTPRWLGTLSTRRDWTIHAFCDASKAAFAACVYVRVIDESGNVRVQLLAAKSRVAPLKQLSIPRLELNGARLLVQLVGAVVQAMKIERTKVTAWTDSTVVLAWLQGHANRWPTFVANRVGEIQSDLNVGQWRHVPGVDNPADVASRGIMPSELQTHELWWSGPSWLKEDESSWPVTTLQPVDKELLEEKKETHIHMCASFEIWSLIDRYSSLHRLLRVTAYCKRIFHRRVGELRADEIREALLFWISQAQRAAFAEEMQQLETSAPLPRRSKLHSLQPFLDERGLLRVGGRLKRAPIPFDERHPFILPHSGALIKLIIVDAHQQTMHAGPKTTTAQLYQRFWIIGARNAVKAIIHKCVVCFRCRPTREQQLMGELPGARVTPQRAFLHTAVDYAGPVMSRTAKGRGQKAHKSWIAVFVCLSSRAVHLDLVSDMTTQAFIAAFKRFTARRGHCSDVYADNGTNFVGAEMEMQKQLKRCIEDEEWASLLARCGTRFHFAPPGSPHFNGLAEAAVKIAKTTMRRAIGEHTLTFEEMCTLLTQIEAIMNSRPLCALTRDPNDTSTLTPGHLLIGQPLTAIPEPNMLDTHDGRLNRWELLTKLTQQFWQQWRREYLHHLQQRSKWTDVRRQTAIGDIVVIRDENLPPTKWALGRITATHPGADGIVRVVTIKTASSVLKRSVVKIATLPLS